MKLSNLDIVQKCDSYYPHRASIKVLKLYYGKLVIGHIIPSVLEAIRDETKLFTIHETYVDFAVNLEGISRQIANLLDRWRREERFISLKGWRDELYPIYGDRKSIIFTIERSAAPLFGLLTYGVHCTLYIAPTSTSDGKVWVSKRSESKQTYPGMLDNSVAGGMSTSLTPLETLVKECEEEASLSPDFVRQRAHCVGSVSYFHVKDETAGAESGLLQPEVRISFTGALTEIHRYNTFTILSLLLQKK